MTSKVKEPTDQEIVEILARRHHITLLPAGGNTFAVFTNDAAGKPLRVEISLKVSNHVLHDEARMHRETAAEWIADPARGEWHDSCHCHVGERRNRMCKKPAIGVVVFRRPGPLARHQPESPTFNYTFRCATHMDKPIMDESAVVFRARMKAELEVARAKRKEAKAIIDHYKNTSDEDKIVEEMRLAGRTEEANELLRQIPRHSYRCDKMRASADNPGKHPRGKDDVACSCDHHERLAEWRARPPTAMPPLDTSGSIKLSFFEASLAGIPIKAPGAITITTQNGVTMTITQHVDHVIVVSEPEQREALHV